MAVHNNGYADDSARVVSQAAIRARVLANIAKSKAERLAKPALDELATLKSIRRHVERLARGDAVANSLDTARDVGRLQTRIQSKNYKSAGSLFHKLNFKFVQQVKDAKLLTRLKVDVKMSTRGCFRSSRQPDYNFDGGAIFDLKPVRNSRHAYDKTKQFQDIANARNGSMPIPLYYKLW